MIKNYVFRCPYSAPLSREVSDFMNYNVKTLVNIIRHPEHRDMIVLFYIEKEENE